MLLVRNDIELNGSFYDAALETAGVDSHTNARLTITLKLFLRPNAGAPRRMIIPQMTSRTRTSSEGSAVDLDGNRFVFDAFPPERWRNFTSFYQSVGQEFWDNKFWLSPPDNFDTSGWGPNLSDRPEDFGHTSTLHPYSAIQPSIDCRFLLNLVDNAAHAHRTIDVYNIVQNLSGAYYRSDELHYSESILDSVGREASDEELASTFIVYQRSFLHEIGHAIGLDHVGVNLRIRGCFDVDDHNITICYGNNFATRDNIMGAGETLSWAEALPWRRAMEVLTNTSRHSWEVHQSHVGPHEVLRTS